MESIREQFLEFQSKHFDVTELQKQVNSALHKIDNEFQDIQNNEDFDKEEGEFYINLLTKHFTEVFNYYTKLFD